MCKPTLKAGWEVKVGGIAQKPASPEYSIKQQKRCLNKVDGNNKLLPTRCPVTSICAPWHTWTHTHTHIILKIQLINKK